MTENFERQQLGSNKDEKQRAASKQSGSGRPEREKDVQFLQDFLKHIDEWKTDLISQLDRWRDEVDEILSKPPAKTSDEKFPTPPEKDSLEEKEQLGADLQKLFSDFLTWKRHHADEPSRGAGEGR